MNARHEQQCIKKSMCRFVV